MSTVDDIERVLEETRRSATRTANVLRERLQPKALMRSAVLTPAAKGAGQAIAIVLPLAAVATAIMFVVRAQQRRRARELW